MEGLCRQPGRVGLQLGRGQGAVSLQMWRARASACRPWPLHDQQATALGRMQSKHAAAMLTASLLQGWVRNVGTDRPAALRCWGLQSLKVRGLPRAQRHHGLHADGQASAVSCVEVHLLQGGKRRLF